MQVTFSAPELPEKGVIVLGVLEGRTLTPSAQALDEKLNGLLGRAMNGSRFRGKKDQILSLLAPGDRLDRIVLLGLGKAAELNDLCLQAAGGKVQTVLASEGIETATVMLDAIEGCEMAPAVMAAEMAYGATLRSYRFSKYLTKEK
jgi:leucyl aminopeptidase